MRIITVAYTQPACKVSHLSEPLLVVFDFILNGLKNISLTLHCPSNVSLGNLQYTWWSTLDLAHNLYLVKSDPGPDHMRVTPRKISKANLRDRAKIF